MTSHDVRDVLNLPLDGSAPRPAKKQKTSAARPSLKGLAREVQNLGGDNPIALVPQISNFKKRRFASRKPAAKWELRPFKNSAREETSLVLRHWRRKTEGEPEHAADKPVVDGERSGETQQANGTEPQLEDSAFAKYNVRAIVPQYSDDQYNSNLQNADWTKDETDYLLGLARDFDLRWPVIWDRYDYHLRLPDGEAANGDSTAVIPAPKARTMEDLKARYYEVAAKMMAVQKPVQYMTHAEYHLHETMANFNPQQEKQRKEFAINAMTRSKEEAREEESLLVEVKRIMARMDRMNEERRELYSRLDYPPTDHDISAFKSSAGLQNLLHTLMNADKSKKRKSLAGPDGVSPSSAGPGGQPASATAESAPRRESIAAAPASSHRESLGGGDKTPVEPAPKNNKKGGQPVVHRKLTEEEEQVYGVSHHDRLGSGPTFRYEKVNKLFTQKSGQQQLRITNALNELDIPPRLFMPTAAVTAQFEKLILAVTQLVDLRKVADKLDTEIKIEEQRRVERERAKAVLSGQTDGAGDGPPKEGEKATSKTAAHGAMPPPPSGEAAASAGGAETDAGQTQQNGTGGDQPAADGAASTADAVQIKVEDTEREKSARPGSSGAHKRSASVLSTTSDKSAKRQKK